MKETSLSIWPSKPWIKPSDTGSVFCLSDSRPVNQKWVISFNAEEMRKMGGMSSGPMKNKCEGCVQLMFLSVSNKLLASLAVI